MANTQRVIDDFDMTKLQKSLKQQQRRAQRMQGVVTKLTPAEVRSLNNNVTASRVPQISGSTQSRKPGRTSPPLTPENMISSQQPPRGNLPTPPRSPDDAAPRRQSAHSTADVPIHSPVPVSNGKANFVTTNHTSRPSSVSSHRSMPTYRGNEITRTGSTSVFRPSMLTHHIVDNPLSQFSRPRQSIGGRSISPVHNEPRQQTPTRSVDWTSREDRSAASPAEYITPPSSVGSTLSAAEREADLAPRGQIIEPGVIKAETVANDERIPGKPSSRFGWHWKRSGTGPRAGAGEEDEIKKLRRRTIAWGKGSIHDTHSVAYENTKPGDAPEVKQTLKGDLPSNKAPALPENREDASVRVNKLSIHPANQQPNSEDLETSRHSAADKGKQKEEEGAIAHDVFSDENVPMYSQCSCCGKLKNPAGNRALSPVFENENLRANFSFEIERANNTQHEHRRSSSSNRPKYTAILPMVVAEGKTVQAKIAPQQLEETPVPSDPPSLPPPVNERGDIIARGSTPVPLVPKRTEEKERKIVRFSSLHFKHEMQRQIQQDHPISEPTEAGNLVEHGVGAADLTKSQNGGSDTYRDTTIGRPQDPSTAMVDHSKLELRWDDNNEDASSSIPTEMTGALMAAINGVSVTFDDIFDEIDGRTGKPATLDAPKINFVSDSEVEQNHPEAAPSTAVYQLVTTEGPPLMGHDPAATPEPATATGAVRTPLVDEPAPTVPQPPAIVPAIKPKSILKITPRSSYNNSPRASVDYTYNLPTSHDASASVESGKGGFATKPKVTARYMHATSGETRTSPVTTRTTTTTTVQGSTITTTTSAGAMKARPEASVAASNYLAAVRPAVGYRTASTDSSSGGQRRPPSSRSNSSISDRPSSSRRGRSSLMESVLAATKQDTRSRFERALGRT